MLEFRTLNRKAVSCFKRNFTSHPSRSLGNNSAESIVAYGGPSVQEVSEENNIGDAARDHSCDNLTKKK